MSDLKDFVIKNGVLTKYVGTNINVVVPSEVKEIGTSAFKGCNKIETVVLPEGLEVIGGRAFAKCTKLKEINLPQSLKKVGIEAFFTCYSLEELIFPEHTEFTRCPVEECRNLKTLVFPSGFKSASRFLFGCNSLETLACPAIDSTKIDAKHRVASVCGYIRYTERFSQANIIEYYNTYIIKQWSRLLPAIFENDAVNILTILAENGKINEKNIELEYIKLATEFNALKCKAFLLDWKNKNLKTDDVLDIFNSELDNFSEYEEFKKTWSFEKAEDETLILTSYKGTQTDVVVPAENGKGKKITKLKEYIFSPYSDSDWGLKSKPKAKVEILNKIEKITIEEGIVAIGTGACFDLPNLKSIKLPKSLEIIGLYAFKDCHNLTIYAPAGSFAEHYAKQKNIPFVAE